MRLFGCLTSDARVMAIRVRIQHGGRLTRSHLLQIKRGAAAAVAAADGLHFRVMLYLQLETQPGVTTRTRWCAAVLHFFPPLFIKLLPCCCHC